MKKLLAMLVMLCTCTVAHGRQDSDGDQIPDSVENSLLSTLAPVIYPNDNGDHRHPPLPLEWVVWRYYLIWYADEARTIRLGDTGRGNYFLTSDLVLSIIQSHRAAGQNYYYAFGYHNTDDRSGSSDPNDPMSWSAAQSRGQGIYGRVTHAPEGGTRYLVQYYMHFGWNETDTPVGCDYGNHEGDWIGISVAVDGADPSNPQILSAVYHNHGRQIFVESPVVIEREGSHPVVYLEGGTNEPWHYFGIGGMQPGVVPPFTTTNKILSMDIVSVPCQVEWETGCNGGHTAVREHDSRTIRYLVTNVVNIGERDHPYPSAESRLFNGYDGWWGATHSGDCCAIWVCSDPVTCPPSPEFQGEMWDEDYRVSECNVIFGTPDLWQTGEPNKPVGSLQGALMRTSPHGSIRIRAGQSSERLTIALPVTITAEGGAVTIGQ